MCGAPYGTRSEERVNSRNDYRAREWDTGWARWSWRCPSCGSAATSGLAVDLLAAGRAGPGVGRRDELSAGCVDPAGGEAGRAARCGRRCPRARSRRWPSTSMDAGPYTFVWLDASTVKVREGGRTVAWSGGTHPRGGPVRQRLTWPGSARAEPADAAAAAHWAAGGAHSHHRCHNGAGVDDGRWTGPAGPGHRGTARGRPQWTVRGPRCTARRRRCHLCRTPDRRAGSGAAAGPVAHTTRNTDRRSAPWPHCAGRSRSTSSTATASTRPRYRTCRPCPA